MVKLLILSVVFVLPHAATADAALDCRHATPLVTREPGAPAR